MPAVVLGPSRSSWPRCRQPGSESGVAEAAKGRQRRRCRDPRRGRRSHPGGADRASARRPSARAGTRRAACPAGGRARTRARRGQATPGSELGSLSRAGSSPPSRAARSIAVRSTWAVMSWEPTRTIGIVAGLVPGVGHQRAGQPARAVEVGGFVPVVDDQRDPSLQLRPESARPVDRRQRDLCRLIVAQLHAVRREHVRQPLAWTARPRPSRSARRPSRRIVRGGGRPAEPGDEPAVRRGIRWRRPRPRSPRPARGSPRRPAAIPRRRRAPDASSDSPSPDGSFQGPATRAVLADGEARRRPDPCPDVREVPSDQPTEERVQLRSGQEVAAARGPGPAGRVVAQSRLGERTLHEARERDAPVRRGEDLVADQTRRAPARRRL